MYKLVIIEDENLLREGLIQMIDFEHFQCVLAGEASNGKEGIELILREKPDIVLLDLYIPLINGFEVLKRTKKLVDYEIIIITGHAEFEYAQKAISLGVSDYLLKPIEKRSLNEALLKAIAKRAPLSENSQDQEYSFYTMRVLDHISNHLDKNLSINEISKDLNISGDHLNRIFKQDTGETIHRVIIQKRIEEACILLRKENSKVYEVAHQVGFNDYKYFYQVFRKIMQQSPKAYQAEKQKKE
jgi:Response regulator containing CheY-like receiver domain and AraC-type DNA-binding domain